MLEERNLKQAVSVVKQEREFLDDEKEKIHSEIQQMEKLNKITESKVSKCKLLNVNMLFQMENKNSIQFNRPDKIFLLVEMKVTKSLLYQCYHYFVLKTKQFWYFCLAKYVSWIYHARETATFQSVH